jgi:hypothetical protein
MLRTLKVGSMDRCSVADSMMQMGRLYCWAMRLMPCPMHLARVAIRLSRSCTPSYKCSFFHIFEVTKMALKIKVKEPIRVILRLNMTFGRELVVLLTKPSMFGKLLVHAWR